MGISAFCKGNYNKIRCASRRRCWRVRGRKRRRGIVPLAPRPGGYWRARLLMDRYLQRQVETFEAANVWPMQVDVVGMAISPSSSGHDGKTGNGDRHTPNSGLEPVAVSRTRRREHPHTTERRSMITILDGTCYIPLTRGYWAMIDETDVRRVAPYAWCADTSGKGPYAMRGLRGADGCEIAIIMMHRVVLNAPDDKVVDHIDGNGLNNRRSNLRLCTQRQNAANQTRGRNKLFSGAYSRGIYRESRTGKWYVSIRGRYRGTFFTLKEAVERANAVLAKAFGEFARPMDYEELARCHAGHSQPVAAGVPTC